MSKKDVVRYSGAEAQGALARGAAAIGAMSLGSMAVGAAAGGAVAVGALAIRSLAIKRARIGRLSIDELQVRRLHVQELITENERSAPHPFHVLERHNYINLTTFRKSGEAVTTPVWFALHDGRLHITTEPDSGKMKRIRNNPRVVLQPCNAWGRPRGESVEGLGREVTDGPTAEGERALRDKYRLGLKLFNLFGQQQIGQIVLEIIPVEEEPAEA